MNELHQCFLSVPAGRRPVHTGHSFEPLGSGLPQSGQYSIVTPQGAQTELADSTGSSQ
jgi:hypothetical protein